MRQSAQVAKSGSTWAVDAPAASLARISNPVVPTSRDRARLDRVDNRIGWRTFADLPNERADPLRIALGLDHDSLARIDDPAREPERRRLAVDEGPEPDTLHGTAHEDARSHSLYSCGVVR